MNKPRETFIDEIPEDHICTLCGEELNPLHDEHRQDGWSIEIWECPACDDVYIRLEYQYDPEEQETVEKLRSLLHEINSLEGRYWKVQDSEVAECPFCHKKEPLRIEWSGLVYRVICDAVVGGCGASIGWEFTQERAIAKWNNRSVPADLEPVIQAKIEEAKQQMRAAVADGLKPYYLIKKCDFQGLEKAVSDFTATFNACDKEAQSCTNS